MDNVTTGRVTFENISNRPKPEMVLSPTLPCDLLKDQYVPAEVADKLLAALRRVSATYQTGSDDGALTEAYAAILHATQQGEVR